MAEINLNQYDQIEPFWIVVTKRMVINLASNFKAADHVNNMNPFEVTKFFDKKYLRTS